MVGPEGRAIDPSRLRDGQRPGLQLMRRVVVIGSTGAGKSTLAAALAARLGCPHVELDGLHWEPGWVMASTAVLRARVAEALAGERWVVDGNYRKARDLIWPRADTLIWLDLPLVGILVALWRRTWRRLRQRELLWSGNRERFATQFLSRDSLFVWAISTYRRHRREWAAALREPQHAHLRVIRLQSRRAIQRWWAGLGPGPEEGAGGGEGGALPT
jgi:adenylate kinase family enzyme